MVQEILSRCKAVISMLAMTTTVSEMCFWADNIADSPFILGKRCIRSIPATRFSRRLAVLSNTGTLTKKQFDDSYRVSCDPLFLMTSFVKTFRCTQVRSPEQLELERNMLFFISFLMRKTRSRKALIRKPNCWASALRWTILFRLLPL